MMSPGGVPKSQRSGGTPKPKRAAGGNDSRKGSSHGLKLKGKTKGASREDAVKGVLGSPEVAAAVNDALARVSSCADCDEVLRILNEGPLMAAIAGAIWQRSEATSEGRRHSERGLVTAQPSSSVDLLGLTRLSPEQLQDHLRVEVGEAAVARIGPLLVEKRHAEDIVAELQIKLKASADTMSTDRSRCGVGAGAGWDRGRVCVFEGGGGLPTRWGVLVDGRQNVGGLTAQLLSRLSSLNRHLGAGAGERGVGSGQWTVGSEQ